MRVIRLQIDASFVAFSEPREAFACIAEFYGFASVGSIVIAVIVIIRTDAEAGFADTISRTGDIIFAAMRAVSHRIRA